VVSEIFSKVKGGRIKRWQKEAVKKTVALENELVRGVSSNINPSTFLRKCSVIVVVNHSAV